jgi:hypothetical protein
MKIINCLISTLVLTVLVLSMFPIATRVQAYSTTLEIIDPVDGDHLFNFTTAQKSVGDTFVINITVNSISDLNGWQIKVAWNSTYLQYVSITLPTDHVFAGKAYIVLGPDTSEPGTVIYGLQLGPGVASFAGSGRLAQVTLKIIQGVSPGEQVECDIAFANIRVDTVLINSEGLIIPFTTINGYYIYSAPWVPPPPAKLYINPSRVVDPTLIAGSTFNVSLNIINASNLHSWSADLLYANIVLNATNVIEGNFLKSAGSTSFSFTIQHDYNSTHGLIQMSCALATGGANGNGVLANVTFQVLDLGESAITIENADLRNPTGKLLPFTTANGYFSNILIAKLSIEPSEVSGPEYLPGTTFWINVTLDDVENLKTCIFNLTYVSSVIMEINVVVPPVLGQTPTKKLIIDDEGGFIWVKLTYPNPITTYNPVTITKVEFQVMAMGVSYINLTDTALSDAAGQPIAHEVYNGIFIGLIRDVAVIDVFPNINIAYEGWVVKVNVTVKNKGNLTETFDVKIYYNDTLCGTKTVENLAPNEERTITIDWNTTGVPCGHNYVYYDYIISAKAGPVPYEFNLSDNSRTDGHVTIRVTGDVDGNGKVDILDVYALVLIFRSYPGKPKWNPLGDLNRDNMIDIIDINRAVINFNRHC